MKKHPMLTVLIILGIFILCLGMVMAIYNRFSGLSSGLVFSNKVGVIPVEGVIVNSKDVVEQLVEFRKDKRIKCIILRVDSPGGGVGASQEIYQEIVKTRKTKHVIASMGGVAASGGYYIAAAADKIVANPGTITGSIGVIMEFMQFQELTKKIGISLEVLKSGEFKDIGSPHREMTEQERVLLNDLILDIQGQFVKAVAEGRNLPEEKVREIADGRVFSGAMARDLGLIDQTGNFQDAVELAKEMTGIEGDVELVYPETGKFGLLEFLLQGASNIIIKTVTDSSQPSFEYRWAGPAQP